MAYIIEIADLRKIYRLGRVEVAALRGINLTVEPGEFLAIVGPSGSGKSTLFHIVGGLTPPTAGHVKIDGTDLAEMTDAERTKMRQRTVGFVFQKFNLLPTLTARENIDIARDISGNHHFDSGHFEEILGLLGIRERLRHRPYALSGGEQQRVAIARAVIGKPDLLLADEPTGNLDEKTAEVVFGELTALVRNSGIGALIATHNLELAQRMDRVVTLHEGRLQAA